MPRPMHLATAALTLALCAPPARATDLTALRDAKHLLQAGVDSSSAAVLLRARAQFQALSAAEPASPALHEWVALATWRAAPLLQGDDARAARLVRDGIAHCDEAARRAPEDAQAPALKAALQGLLTRYQPDALMTLGMEAETNLNRALALGPRDPRVWLLYGIHTLHKPAAYGGGPEVARGRLDKSMELFAAATVHVDDVSFDWGWDDACLWAGQCAMRLRDFAGALNLFDRALALNPANAWVHHRLLPAARDSVAAANTKEP